MAIPKSRPITFRPIGVSDAIDGSNVPLGAMASLQNLIPNPANDRQFVPRPAAVPLSAPFVDGTDGEITALLVVGNIAYGMVAQVSGTFNGKDKPFAYNLLTSAFETISGILVANLPTTPALSGDWTPPIMAVVGNRIVVCHSGFAGGATQFYFGWLDISGFSSNTVTGTTHTNTTLDTLSTNVLVVGWQPGMIITGPDIPANTYIVSIATGGLSLTLSNAATGGHAGGTYTVVGGTATSPQWGAGNTNLNKLSTVPVSVVQFNARAYFAVSSGVVLSDAGFACQVTNASQVLTFSNGIAVTALGPLPLASPLTGGIIQAVIAFQSVAAMQIITGDPTTSDLRVNLLKSGTGTLSPLTLAPCNKGLAFVSPEGLRIIDFSAVVSDPIGDHGNGVAVPFIYVINPSRSAAASGADTLRISAKNGNAAGQPVQEYWFDLTRGIWTGPHTFPADLIQPWGSTFLIVPDSPDTNLWQSDSTPGVSSTYTENGTTLSWIWQPVLIPDNEVAAMNSVVDMTLAVNLPPQALVTCQALDEAGSLLASAVNLRGSGMAASVWGSFTWGSAVWFGGAGVFKQVRLAWDQPLVFKQFTLRTNGNSLAGFVIGNLYFKMQELGYLLESTP